MAGLVLLGENRRVLLRIARYLVSFSTVLAITLLSARIGLNTTTVALSLLLVVLAAATLSGP